MVKIKLNRIVKYLIASDLVFYTGWGLISPIFAIFILQNIAGGNALVVGFATAVNLISRSLLRVPFGMLADKSQRRSFNFMFWGLLICASVPIGFIFSSQAWHIYVLQCVLGCAAAMTTAGWTCIFSRHMDKGKESTEWGIDAVAVGLGPGIAGALGGLAVSYFSFSLVFVAVAAFGLAGVIILLFVKKDVLKNKGFIFGSRFTQHDSLRLKKARMS